MKRIRFLAIVFSIIGLSSCDLSFLQISDTSILEYSIESIEEEIDYNIPTFSSLSYIQIWIAFKIERKHDVDVHGVAEYYQSPLETLQLKSGDCEDVAILFLYLAHQSLHLKGNIAIYDVPDETEDYDLKHAVPMINGKNYDPFFIDEELLLEEENLIDYDSIMLVATECWTK